MEDVEIAFLIAVSIIAVLITSIWWATRTKKRQAESTKPVKIPLPQDDLRAARNRFYQQKELEKQPSDQQPVGTGPAESSESTVKADKRDRMYSFATLKNTWVSKEHGNDTQPPATNCTSATDGSDMPDDTAERPSPKPRKHNTISQTKSDKETQPTIAEDAKESVEDSDDSKIKESPQTNVRKSSLLIQPIRQKVIHYKYGSLPHAKLSSIGYDELGYPIIKPIKSFYKLLSWLPGFDNFNVPCVPLRRRGNTKPDVKILVCHDMMGGYTLDKYPQGVSVTEDYHFYHWHLIEAFVYFSHNFITIPPASWTNAAHANGVLSMGTIITEWEDGAQTCNHLLSSTTNVEKFVDQCVSLANYYQFDGWLVNIENNLQVSVICSHINNINFHFFETSVFQHNVSYCTYCILQPNQVEMLLQLLKSLTHSMHALKPWSQVIWYDSVITSGQLKWQNALNQFNEPFFNACDGIFLNYTWNDWMLASSKTLAGSSRITDVYVGIDVFGRGCFGGGGYNSVAVSLVCCVCMHGCVRASIRVLCVYSIHSVL